MAKVPLPDVDYLRQCFLYDPESGVLTWLARPIEHFPDARAWKIWTTKNAGKHAGSPHLACVGIKDHPHLLHRVIWKLVTGEEPPDQIDHRDQDFMNNRWSNLRAATRHQNGWNRGAQSNNETGLKGVSQDKSKLIPTFYARLTISGRPTRIGTYRSAEEAHAAYCSAAMEHYGEFWSAGTASRRSRRQTTASVLLEASLPELP